MLFRFNLLRILDVASPRSFLVVAFGIQLGSSFFFFHAQKDFSGEPDLGRSVGRTATSDCCAIWAAKKAVNKKLSLFIRGLTGNAGPISGWKKRKKSALFFGDNLHWETIFFKPPRNCRFQDAKLREKSLLKKGPRIIRQVFFLFSLQESSSFSRRNSFFFL